MNDMRHPDVTLDASTTLAVCALVLLIAAYVWAGFGLVRIARVGLPMAIHSAQAMRF